MEGGKRKVGGREGEERREGERREGGRGEGGREGGRDPSDQSSMLQDKEGP